MAAPIIHNTSRSLRVGLITFDDSIVDDEASARVRSRKKRS